MSENQKKHPLSHQEFYRLCTWLTTNAEDILEKRPTYTEVMRRASEALGTKVSENALMTARQTTNVDWRPHSYTGEKPGKRIDELEKNYATWRREIGDTIDALRRKYDAEIAVLRGLVHTLYHRLGEAPPPGYVLPPEPSIKKVS